MIGFRFKNLFFLLGIILLSTSCLKDPECGECVYQPSQLFFKVVDQETGANLFNDYTYSADSLKLYYFKGDTKTYLDIFVYNYYNQMVLNSQVLSWVLLENTEETFYLQLNSQDTDTIFARMLPVEINCCTYYPIDSLAINGKIPETDAYGILIKK